MHGRLMCHAWEARDRLWDICHRWLWVSMHLSHDPQNRDHRGCRGYTNRTRFKSHPDGTGIQTILLSLVQTAWVSKLFYRPKGEVAGIEHGSIVIAGSGQG